MGPNHYQLHLAFLDLVVDRLTARYELWPGDAELIPLGVVKRKHYRAYSHRWGFYHPKGRH